ncbi:putrescine importer [Scopulibacillus daqui]|uniref:Putrescine importer n=1 Tax=Scopulibacillus daqui TaxID=1469162 RepID=A0ABS2Q1U6_9BACL|nr:APC family permease [Scopulibacillus daqui]MBM7645694.1 putrescine importer [Scopulibacillus daqui]
MSEKTTLKRTLGLWAIVGLGLGYMTPTVIFDTFGIVSGDTHGVVPLAYLASMVAMLFTALSYGKMVRVFPSAGSAYTYTKETMNPHLGFMVGWAALLDYILLPMVNALIIRIYMQSLFPHVPAWVWVVSYVIIVTGVIIWSMNSTSNLNMFLLAFSITLIIAFIILSFIQLAHGMGEGTIFTTQPLFHANVHISQVLMGATVVCFSFIGFDAVTMYTEEAKNPSVVPKAIILTVLIGGGVFFIAAYFTQALFPDISIFKNKDDTLPEIGLFVGGKIFQALFIAGGFASTFASGLSSHASVSRLLYVMGRNGVFPRKLFGYVHPRFRTPIFDIILVGVISLFAITPSLDLISSVINFGALIAFTFVNFSVIAYFVFRKKRYKTAKDVFSFIILPLIGAGCTGVLWYFLHSDALKGGIVWVMIGFAYMLYKTRFFRTKAADFGFEQTEKSAETNL